MASFEQHVNVAIVATGVIIVPIHASGLLSVNHALLAFALGVIGGMLPDLDSDNSKPLQIAFKIMSVFLPILVLLSLSDSFSILNILGLWLVASMFLHLVIFKIFLMLTVHRGIFHTVPMGILFGQVVTFTFYEALSFSFTQAVILGFFTTFGFLIHLLLDEIFSVNALGIRFKKSFGTAFKFYDANNKIGTLVIYILNIVIFIILPSQVGIYTNIISAIKNISI